MMLEIGIIAGCKYNDSGALTSQIVLHGAGSSCTPALAYSPFGFKGRPRSGVTDSDGNYTDGAVALYWYEGSTLHSIPLDDGRRSTKLPALDEGGSCWYGDTDDAVSFYDGSGNLTLGAPKAKTVTIAPLGGKVVMGDAPQALAGGPAFAQLVQILITALAGNCVNGAPLTTSTVAVQALQALQNLQTTELTAT